MAVRRFSTSSRSLLKFYNIFCAMFVILNWRGLLIIPRNDFVPSDTRGTLIDWTGVNYSTSTCNLAGRHLGLFSCGRRGINNSLLFRRKGFFRPVMYYSNSNAIFQPELLIICSDVNVNPGPVSKRNQARSTAPTCPVCEKAVAKNQRRFACWMCCDMTHVKCSSPTADSRVFSASSPVSWTCNRCAFASLPFFEESSSDDFNASTFSSAVQFSNEELSTILLNYSKNLKIGQCRWFPSSLS